MNHYYLNEPSAISFSGGQTSAMMLYECIQAHGGMLPNHVKVIFANTGKEAALETLDFVRDCGEHWGVDIVWLECHARQGVEGENKYVYETMQVDYGTASRNGEPFAKLIKARNFLPNPMMRFCTQELKIIPIHGYMTALFPDEEKQKAWQNIIGIRADEPRRFAKSNTKNNHMPMYHAGVTKEDVEAFWQKQNFRLQLQSINGVTSRGNCDLCFLKGSYQKQSLIRDNPASAEWWANQERLIGSTFRNDQPSYATMIEQAKNQPDLFESEDESLADCFCGD